MSEALNAGKTGDVHDSAIESIAMQYEMDKDDVRLIYEEQLDKLTIGSRIGSFLPVLCTRHVKEIILHNFRHPRPV